jgi:hypothetical protein
MGGGGRGEKDADAFWPPNLSQLLHIFRKKDGHFPKDSPMVRARLKKITENEANLLGTDRNKNKWYAETTKDGKQVWASVRNGRIQNGGINNPPKTKWPALEDKK